MQIGQLHHAQVDGEDCVIYLSLSTEEKGAERRNHCYRYCPPSNEIIPASCDVKVGEKVERNRRA